MSLVHVRYVSKSDKIRCLRSVCLAPDNGLEADVSAPLFRAITGHQVNLPALTTRATVAQFDDVPDQMRRPRAPCRLRVISGNDVLSL
jgi:hypothetical protein